MYKIRIDLISNIIINAMAICYVHAFCQQISIFQVHLFHLYGAYKGYMGVTYMSLVSPISVGCKN